MISKLEEHMNAFYRSINCYLHYNIESDSLISSIFYSSGFIIKGTDIYKNCSDIWKNDPFQLRDSTGLRDKKKIKLYWFCKYSSMFKSYEIPIDTYAAFWQQNTLEQIKAKIFEKISAKS